MKKIITVFVAATLPASSLEHTSPEPCVISVHKTEAGAELVWAGHAGHTYFVHMSPSLQNWVLASELRHGAGSHTYFFPTTEDKFFFRVRMTNIPTNHPGLADFDGDGIGNQAELDATPQTDPLSADSDRDGVPDGAGDSDGNGLGDGWEIAHFGSTGQSPTADPDGDGFSNLDEYLMGGHPVRTYTTAPPDGAVNVYQPN